uniref:NADH-ubiquinone oxidoreductase chain 1 n=1 Tax=Rhynchopus euleeides TaxID=630703 RepID=A0A2D2AK07_9EUGL|nr:NADH dehydrogenase subunit 1 [Rhynchopus euleeides]
MLSSGILVIIEVLGILAGAVVLSSYERRAMAFLHSRDGPTVYLLLGLAQPLVEGAKLAIKSTAHSTYGVRGTTSIHVAILLVLSLTAIGGIGMSITTWYHASTCTVLLMLILLGIYSLMEIGIAHQQLSRYAVLACARILSVYVVVEVCWSLVLVVGILHRAMQCYAYHMYSTSVLVMAGTVCSVLLYVVLSALETSLHPYDVLESEPEIVSGWYTDHGGVSFMMIYLSDGITCWLLMMQYIVWYHLCYATTPCMSVWCMWSLVVVVLTSRYLSCRYRVQDVLVLVLSTLVSISAQYGVCFFFFFFF